MKYIAWDQKKNEQLKKERGISFEEVLQAIIDGHILATLKHPNATKYAHQYIHIIQIDNYAYIVPFVEDEEKIFFKTIIPSRVATKKYMKSKEVL